MRTRSAKSRHPDAPRSVIRANPHRTVGGFSAPDAPDVQLEWESWGERYAIVTLLHCADVLQLRTQSRPFKYKDEDGVEHKYTPDLVATTDKGSVSIEIKPLKFLVRGSNLQKYVSIARAAIDQGISLRFLTDEQIEVEPRLPTLLKLRRYARSPLPLGLVESATRALSCGQMELATLASQPGLSSTAVFTLIAQKHLTLDLDKPLNGSSIVRLPRSSAEPLTYARIQNSGRHACLLEQLAMGCEPTDKYLLASAAAGRQPRHADNPWTMVGGCSPRRTNDHHHTQRASATRAAGLRTDTDAQVAPTLKSWLKGR